MAEKEKNDGLSYIKELNREINKLDKKVTTLVVIDEEKLVQKVTNKMQRDMSRRTTESLGGF